MTHELTDYATLLDAETLAFIEQTNAWYPPGTIDASIDEQRAIYDAMCRTFFAGHPVGVSATDQRIRCRNRTIPIRRYRYEEADAGVILLYFHGGGFVAGGLDSHDDVCAELCHRTCNTVVSVDYRLAPEHLHPAAFDDALAAFLYVAEHESKPILLCGDSAGGTLAAAVAGATRDYPQAAIGQLLIYPGLGGATDRGSYLTHAEAPLLTTREVEFYQNIISGNGKNPADPTLAPLRDNSFADLPPTMVLSAECDPLSDDGLHYCEAISAAGGRAIYVKETGLVHGYLRARHSVDRARISFDRIVNMINELAIPW